MHEAALRRAVIAVATLNFAYFFVEFGVARHIGSVSLFADSIDFLEDASVNFLVLIALGWSSRRRAAVGMFLALLLLLPGIATAWMAWQKFRTLAPPAELAMSVTGLGALIVNVYCAFLLVRVRNVAGSLSRAAFLSARNDAFANIAIILAAGITAVVGVGLAGSRCRPRYLPDEPGRGARGLRGRPARDPRRRLSTRL